MWRTFRATAVLFMIAVVALLVLTLWARTAPRPAGLGVHDGHLAPCGERRNCVSSQDPPGGHWMEPLHYRGSPEEARTRLFNILTLLPRTRLLTEEPDYLAFECRTWGFEFIDDLEFWFDPINPVIHFRSASRRGMIDLGWNQSRMNSIRVAFERQQE